MDVEDLLPMSLQLAVPLRLAELRQQPSPDRRAEVIEEWRRLGVEAIAHRGDVLQYGSKRRGETADVFNDAAKGVAALATLPGGAVVFGVCFCERHYPGGTHLIEDDDNCCPSCLDEFELYGWPEDDDTPPLDQLADYDDTRVRLGIDLLHQVGGRRVEDATIREDPEMGPLL